MSIPTYYPLIHNEWVKTYKSIKIRNPYDGDTIAKVYLADGDFLDMAVESAQKGFQISRQLSGFERYDYLIKIAKGLETQQEKIARLITAESGKPLRYARSEVARAILTFTWAAEEARRFTGEYLPLDVLPQTKGYFGITRRFPMGVILGISPFNFPLNLVAHKVAPAIATGNAIILKPASQTPISALKLGEIIQAAGLPAGVVNMIPCSGKIAETLVKDGRIKKLSFTGSAEIGWYLRGIGGKKHVTLELGGNAAAIVEPDTPLEQIVPRLVEGAFAHAGQICISIQRIFVRDSIFDIFLEKFKQETQQNAVMGNPLDDATMVGPMISPEAAKKVESWIQEAIKRGARLATGGNRRKIFLEPTILTNTTPDMKVSCEEVFAPVVCIEPYHDFLEALRMVNHSHYGLQASVFTNNFENIQRAFAMLEVGGVIINDYPTFRIDPMPYGGVKDSGIGREGIRYAMEEITELKLLAVKGI